YADIYFVNSAVGPGPAPNLGWPARGDARVGRRRHDHGLRGDGPDRSGPPGCGPSLVVHGIVVPTRRERAGGPLLRQRHAREPFHAVGAVKAWDYKAHGKTVLGRERLAVHLIGEENVASHALKRQILHVGIDADAAETAVVGAGRPNKSSARQRLA